MLLASGRALSVQAGQHNYCSPRLEFPTLDLQLQECQSFTYFQAFEVGYPDFEHDLLAPYAEDTDAPTSTVYPFVPASTINTVITEHGGVVGYRCSQRWVPISLHEEELSMMLLGATSFMVDT